MPKAPSGAETPRLLPGTKKARLALAATLLLGLLLRVLVSPGAPVHANDHGFEEIRALVEYSSRAAGKTGPYGATFFVVMNGLLSVFGKNEATLFLLNRLFGTLAIFGMYLLAKALLFSEGGAIFAALLLCVSPSQVWLSGTESQMVLHLCLALTGLALLIAAVRASDRRLLWPAAALIALSSAMHVPTVVLLPVAAAFALWAGIVPAMKKDPAFRRHALACGALAAIAVLLHALSLNSDSLARGIDSVGFSRSIGAWATVENVLWDPTLTPLIVAPLALAGALLMLRRRAGLAWPLAAAAALLIPLSFTVCACRTDALRYQSPTHWVYYLLAAFPFSGALPLSKPRRGAAFWAALVLLAAASAPGLVLLDRGNENIQEYRFMREAAATVPSGAAIRLPARTARGRLQTDFPDYLHEDFLLKGDEPDPFPQRKNRWVYEGLDCYKVAGEETAAEAIDPGSGLRKECLAACAGSRRLVMEKEIDARRPAWGYQQRFYRLSTERPILRLYACEDNAAAARRAPAPGCAGRARRDWGPIHLAVGQYRDLGAARRAKGVLTGLEAPCAEEDLLLDYADDAARSGEWDESRSALSLASVLEMNGERERRIAALRSRIDARR